MDLVHVVMELGKVVPRENDPNCTSDTAGCRGPALGQSELHQKNFRWTPATISLSVGLFLLTAAVELLGGWMLWHTVKSRKPWWWGLCGAACMVVFGFLPSLQPSSDFGRVWAVYCGIFIFLSYMWAWGVDHVRPDAGDWIGSCTALVGVGIAYFWPRSIE